ncbi:MAG: glutathione peroxidase [Saprospiraceae bacterium]|nr:glutathione peroxidase [Saprospiraceae bacterium]
MTYISVSVVAIATAAFLIYSKASKSDSLELDTQFESIYDFTMEDIYGEEFSLSEYKGKKILLVNTASKCGLTYQYEQLQELYEQYKDQNFEIIGFPSNDFAMQERGSNDEIASFCQKNYGVTFKMMSKIKVKGNKMHPLYIYLTQKKYNGYKDSKVSWNFQKYLIGEEGKLEKIVSPKTNPKDAKIIDWIES